MVIRNTWGDVDESVVPVGLKVWCILCAHEVTKMLLDVRRSYASLESEASRDLRR